MDLFGSITGVLSGVRATAEVAGAALEIRDFNATAVELAKLHRQLLDAQQQLLTYGGDVLALQAHNRELAEQVKHLTAQLAERGRYELFELGVGEFVYRSTETKPEHYLCQVCFDGGVKSVLQKRSRWYCTVCRNSFGPSSSSSVMVARGQGPRWDGF